MIKRLTRKTIYKDEWLTLYQDGVRFDDNSKGTIAWADRKDGVGIVVVTKDNKILLNKEYRYIVNEYSWEIPGGGIDEGETPEVAAIRELYEETGIKAEKVEKVGVFYPLNSFNSENVILFYTIIEPTEPTLSKIEPSENILEHKYFTFDEVLQMIDSGKINDALTANAIQIIIRKLQKV